MHTKRNFVKFCALALVATILANGARAKSCLWKVTSKTGTLYLQGSIHVLTAESYPLAPTIEQAYAESETLVLEVDMKEMVKSETQQRIMQKAMLPGSKTLQNILTPDTYQQLNAMCTEAGLPIIALEKFKPWFAATTLAFVKMQAMGFDPQYGLDKYFYDKAVIDTKPVVGLESVDFQIDLFDRLSESNPNDFVTRTLADLSVIESEMENMETAWRAGDINAVDVLIAKGFKGYLEFYKTFVTDRNERWLKIFEELLQETKTHMVVVGAGHLPGKSGLLELLKEKGYTLEQL